MGGIKIEDNVAVPMRDGTILRADIFRPDTAGPFPTLVVRTPYDKRRAVGYHFMDPLRMARNGYAVVMQDCRGCLASEGDFYPMRNEAKDGYDTVEWAARQEWSNQRVGMYGYSYPGTTQWTAAREQPPHLVAIAPGSSPTTLKNGFFRRGVFLLQTSQAWAFVMAGLFARRNPPPPGLLEHMPEMLSAMDNLEQEARCLPLNAWPVAKWADCLGYYADWLAHPENDGYWRELEVAAFEKTTVPAFIVASWHDLNSLAGTFSSYTGMKQQAGSAEARKHTRIIVGPWGHDMLMPQKVGDIDYGIRASADAIDYMGIHIRWFDYWLKGIDNGLLAEPPVRIFVMGDNVWRNENEWPLARTQYTSYYLRGSGQTHAGNLSPEAPANEEPDVYDYDPLDPVPTQGGSILSMKRGFGPLDQRAIETRADVLVYTTHVLASDVEVTGPVTLKLYALSSAPDTDFTAKLVDVWPTGEAYILLDGIVRARYINSDQTPEFIEPNQVYEYTIDLSATSNVFKAGHRIRLEVSSSNFPKYDRNPNTGHEIGVDAETRVATQKIFHDGKRPSHLVLPVIPR